MGKLGVSWSVEFMNHSCLDLANAVIKQSFKSFIALCCASPFFYSTSEPPVEPGENSLKRVLSDHLGLVADVQMEVFLGGLR